jgi:PAS domain-containing protein
MFDAINRVQAVIEFGLDGTIQHANENFLNAMGYSLDEVRGKHHSMFVEPPIARAPNTSCSGKSSAVAISMPANISASAKAAVKCGFRQATTRSSTLAASRSKS